MAFEGKTCLVTGGTKGIGEATVEAFAKEKAQVFTCSRNQSELDQKLEQWKSKGYNVQVYFTRGCVCDVSKNEDLEAMTQKMEECFGGKLDVLVNNAGIIIRGSALNIQDSVLKRSCFDLNVLMKEHEALMDINVKGTFNLSKLCNRLLKAAGSSSVILMGSIAGGETATSAGPSYGTTKAMMHQLTKSLACEWALDGIRVNCVSPGIISTQMTTSFTNEEKKYKTLMGRTPMKRVGQPSEVADVILFLAGDGASFMTGQTLFVDGGYSVCGIGY